MIASGMQVEAARRRPFQFDKTGRAEEPGNQANGDQRQSQQHRRARKARRLPITLKHTNGFRHKSCPSGLVNRRSTVMRCRRVAYRLVLTGATS